jgi:hypothetical protein
MGKAVACYWRAAKAGNPEAMGLLGLCFEKGEGVAVDPAIAVTWYRKGAEAGLRARVRRRGERAAARQEGEFLLGAFATIG